MKLIDLLVRELPKLGGWPESYTTQLDNFIKKEKLVLIVNSKYSCFEDWGGNRVERDQYQSALAASQNVEWSGDGLPPVGCECEYLDSNGEWYPVTIKYASDQLVVISGITKIFGVEQWTEISKDIIIDKPQFRPLRSEVDRKRDAAAKEMARHANDDKNRGFDAGLRNCLSIYDAIAAGKIPGMKLED